MKRDDRHERERKKYDLGGPDPIRQALVAVVLLAAFFMAIEALVYQIALTSVLPANVTFSWPNEAPDPQAGGGESATHYVK